MLYFNLYSNDKKIIWDITSIFQFNLQIFSCLIYKTTWSGVW